jgi:hypothetical protein
VQHHDGEARDARPAQRTQTFEDLSGRLAGEHAAIGMAAGVHLDDLAIQRLGPADAQIEETGARLIADGEHVPETPGDDQRALRPPPLEQGVRCHRCPQPHLARRDGLTITQAEQASNADEWRAIVRENLGDLECPAHPIVLDAIGERAATIHPERVAHATSVQGGVRRFPGHHGHGGHR